MIINSGSRIKNLVLSCRPQQWSKNLIVFLAPFFVFSFDTYIWIASIKSFISFCLISSSIYLINDSVDKKNDQKHPTKKYRPIASGAISVKSAIRLSLILLLISLYIGFNLNNYFGTILIVYFFVQILYCFKLKYLPIIELFCVASGFVLRSIGGGVAAEIFISYWFLLSVGMLSLFIAIEKGKRRYLFFIMVKD